jgi:carboxymethylenebutenolidase
MTEPPRLATARLTTRDFDPEVLNLLDQYVHGLMDRRTFLNRTALLVGATAATGVLAALAPQFAAAQQVKPDDPRLHATHLEFASPKGYDKGRGYLVRPAKAQGTLPKILVVHENRGLNPHIEDITRRLALEGYLAFAPDALFPVGGYPGDEDAARKAFGTLDQVKVQEYFLAGADALIRQEHGKGRLGAVGFCWGGGMVNFLATRVSDIVAAAPFYGMAPTLADVANIHAEMLLVFAETDERINAAWPDYQKALDAAHVKYEMFQPAGTTHGFNNDTTPRYSEAAATEAWTRTLALFDRQLKRGKQGSEWTSEHKR